MATIKQPKKPSANKTQDYLVKQIIQLLRLAMYKKDGKPTKFARKYGIKRWKDFYAIFKLVKENFKRNRESIAFEIIIDLAKSVSGRVSPRLGEFGAFVWTLRVVGFIMDDLKYLQKAIKVLEESKKE